MKYVMINYSTPIIFTEANLHRHFEGFGNITSAGKFRIKCYEGRLPTIETYGKSVGLKLEPAEEDAKILEMFLIDGE